MQTKEYRFADVDKSEWGPGPWIDEPDKKQWLDEATGLPCLIKRNMSGALCGYVGVAEGHPAFGKAYDKLDVEVHGDLTFAAFCSPHEDSEQGEAHAICHIVEPGENDRVYWFGFDCAHFNDVAPMTQKHFSDIGLDIGNDLFGASYKPFPYVESEVAKLAAQLKVMQPA